ncbi:MAG: amino acid permease [Lachnospiraceae bacterium]|nr:amino acid permease [Lachnospiraceae bacterium]
MAKEGIMPEWFGRLNEEGSPRNALIVLMAASLLAPFLGRTAIGWIVDVNTIGAIIVYGYVSGAAYVTARAEEGKKRYRNTGIAGLVISVIFFLYFMAFSVGAMATESYLILAIWGILGFVYFRHIFGRDREHRFGRSTVVWLGLLFLIFFTTLLWVRKATDDMTKSVVESISKFYEEKNPLENQETIDATEAYLAFQMEEANRLLTRNSIIQMGIIIAGLAIMFSVYSIISRREKEMELEKLKAQERSRAKSAFLSNMSHDIRTPMNAIVGYTSLAKRDDASLEEIRGYLDKIEGSSQHLLALINDVLEMSRIESGKMELELVAADLRKMMESIGDVFSTQMEQKKIRFTVDADSLPQSRVYCDKNRLNRVLLNLISNAYKFTPEGGTVQVSVRQTEEEAEKARYEIRVRDSGIGMTEEFAAKVFEAFERERNATVSGIQGTGLGMAITKSMVDLMGGTIEVHTAPGQGTEFVIRLWLDLEEGRGSRHGCPYCQAH